MSPFFRLVCDFDILTPMFLGGASQEAELRVPSIKGALRFWYRALDPKFDTREQLLFGSGGKEAAQSLLLLRCKAGQRAQDRTRWSDARAEQYNQGSGRQTKNGLIYLGYPLALKGNESRTALVPGARFTLEVTCHRSTPKTLEPPVTPLRAALASTWALGHFGSLGTRARRGFGAVALTDWRIEDRDGQPLPEDEELAALPLLHRTPNAAEWTAGAHRGLDVIRRWLGAFDTKGKPSRHPHFGPRAGFTLGTERARRDDWRSAVLSLGRALQNFRQRKQPDYDLVKEHVLFESREGGRRIQRTPERATFGLPLAFRYGSVPRGRPVTFAPVHGERHASLLFLRPVIAGETLVSLFLRLDGEVPGMDTRVGLRGTGRSLDPAAHNAMDDFMREMKGKG